MSTTAVSIILFTLRKDGVPEFWMSKRLQGSYRGLWQPPGGKVEDGEDPQQAAHRELHEETGILSDAPACHWQGFRVTMQEHPKHGVFQLYTFFLRFDRHELSPRPVWIELREQTAWVPLTAYEVLQLKCIPQAQDDVQHLITTLNLLPQ